MNEKQYPTRFCPYCTTPITSPTKYCEICGAEITWSIKEIQAPLWPWTPISTYIITSITYGVFLLLTIAIMFYYIFFWGIPLFAITIIAFDPAFMILLILTELVFILIPWAYVTSLKVKPEKLGVTTGGGLTLAKDLLLGVVVGAVIVPVILALDLFELLAPGGPPPSIPTPTELFWVGVLCLSVILVIAPAEEFFFRGFIQNSLDVHYGRIGGLIVSSIIFGFAHMNPLIGVIHTIGGIFLGLLYLWRGRRLAGPIAAHATYDCLIILLDAFFL